MHHLNRSILTRVATAEHFSGVYRQRLIPPAVITQSKFVAKHLTRSSISSDRYRKGSNCEYTDYGSLRDGKFRYRRQGMPS
jgi:hypothetical protein